MPLKDEKEYKDRKDELVKKNNWYRFEKLKLPKEGYWHALYFENPQERIQLFTYFGQHYTFKMKDLFDAMNASDIRRVHSWTEEGKTTLPTKSNSFKNLGPEADTEVDKMLRDMGEVYEDYINRIHWTDYDDILNEDNLDELKGIIKNKEHLDEVLKKAKELKGN